MAAPPRAWLATPSGQPRARAYGIAFDGMPGAANAITDVDGVQVGMTTLVEDDGPLKVGDGPVRTGVTAILPRPRDEVVVKPVFAGLFSQNGNGEMTGSHLIEEIGAFNGPVTITNTHSCGVARDASVKWMYAQAPAAFDDAWGLPVAAETDDSFLNDVNGHHVTEAHVLSALDGAAGGGIEEGSVGGGTGMIAFAFKAGSGTASRIVDMGGARFTVGAFVQANFGARRNFTIRGMRVGPMLREPALRQERPRREKGSIIGIIATDAPFLPHQLKRLARRAPLGVAATGGFGYHSSGDIFLAFSTANAAAAGPSRGGLATASFVPDADIDPFFDAVVQTIEEAILNAMVAAQDMTGRDGNFVPALPRSWLEEVFGRVGAATGPGATRR
jgi:D-aminopeptidase